MRAYDHDKSAEREFALLDCDFSIARGGLVGFGGLVIWKSIIMLRCLSFDMALRNPCLIQPVCTCVEVEGM